MLHRLCCIDFVTLNRKLKVKKSVYPFIKHFSKTRNNFEHQISCLKFASDFLKKIQQDNSPVATILTLERKLEDHQKNLGMAPIKCTTDGQLGFDASTLFIQLYNV